MAQEDSIESMSTIREVYEQDDGHLYPKPGGPADRPEAADGFTE
jgi:hypothetical protein